MAVIKANQLSQTPTVSKVRVLGGFYVPSTLYAHVEQYVSKQMNKLVADKLYRLQDLYGDAEWEKLGNSWVKQMAGRCFAHMVSRRLFSLEFVQYKRYATKRYKLKCN